MNMQTATHADPPQRVEMKGFRTDFPPDVLALADRVRQFIRETVPDVEERIYKGNCAAGYHEKRSGCFCGLWLEEKCVHLMFPNGAFLPDPEDLLKRGAKQVNYVTLRPGGAFPEDALFHLVVAALLYGAP